MQPAPSNFVSVYRIFSAFLFVLISAGPFVLDAQQPIFSRGDRHYPVQGANGMVATQEPFSSEAGLEVLRQGGNAIDAAVVIGLAKAVTLPRAGNLAGGGFMVIHWAETGETRALDYRETAPARATRDMFLDDAGNPVPNRSRFSHLAVGVPGSVAGLHQALETYGTLS